uniref:Uncharacterized protein n=1 Tax=Candidatus Kentrum sp. TC TaxID=2126339 RepID=A0A450YCU7_9GAMM|nr:MAG: hypothetical protein BECKTC1821E_GA0114239_100480 [Candidatus Kentron sp. TC]
MYWVTFCGGTVSAGESGGADAAGIEFDCRRVGNDLAARNPGRPRRAGRNKGIANDVNREMPRGFFRLGNRTWRDGER